MRRATRQIGSLEGLFVAPEGAATFAALQQLVSRGEIDPAEQIVLFNTGAAWKYGELLSLPELPVLDPDDPLALERVVP